MEKIILLGRMNELTEQIYNAPKEDFIIQLSVDGQENPDVLDKQINLTEPALAVLSLAGLHEQKTGFFAMMKAQHPTVPVVLIGTDSEFVKTKGLAETEQFEFLSRPFTPETLVETCKKFDKSDPKVKLLIIDDDPVMLRTTKAMLDDMYEVYVAPSGEKGLKMLEKKSPDVILLDYEMPEIDGKDTLWAIRDDERYASLPVIFLTGISDKKHIQDILFLKPSAYLLKPPVKEVIVAEVERVLKK